MTRQEYWPPKGRRFIPGFWVIPDWPQGVPAKNDDPTGVVMIERTIERPATRFRAVDVMPCGDQKPFLLSQHGRYTYRHSSELLHGREVLFVPIDEWPIAYKVSYGKPMSASSIGGFFGQEARSMARNDVETVVLWLSRKKP
jgi:hypothetical protein